MSTLLVMLVLVTVAVLTLMAVGFVLGFRVGGRLSQSELQRSRFEAARAERRLHDLARDTFVTMAEHAERRVGER